MSTATELLSRALDALDGDFPGVISRLKDDIRTFLAAEEQYDALSERYVEGLGGSMKACKEFFEREAERVKELLAAEPEIDEPVAYMDPYHGVLMWAKAPEYAEYKGVSPEEMKLLPLYTRPEPAIRKPMTEEEISKAYQIHFGEKNHVADFWDGIRFAEKHHGIGGDDE